MTSGLLPTVTRRRNARTDLTDGAGQAARGDDADKIRALDLGADDFVTKPFSVAELIARIRAQLRRHGGTATEILTFDSLEIDLERRRVVQGGARCG